MVCELFSGIDLFFYSTTVWMCGEDQFGAVTTNQKQNKYMLVSENYVKDRWKVIWKCNAERVDFDLEFSKRKKLHTIFWSNVMQRLYNNTTCLDGILS